MITDATTLQETLELENKTLHQSVSSLQVQVKSLQEQLDWFKRQIFGKRSEKVVPTSNDFQLLIPGIDITSQSTKPSTTIVPAHERKKLNRDGKNAITFPEDLPIERQVIDLPEEEKICKDTGVSLVKIGEEITQKIAHKPGSYYIKEIVRAKYAVPQNSDAGIITAAMPESLLARCQADESFLADILVKKYADHLPLYRQSEILSRERIFISRQTLTQWVTRAGIALKPLKEAMSRLILESGNVFIDETPINMLSPGKGKTQQAYMWVLVGGNEQNPPYRVYEFYENRKHSNAEKLLNGYDGFLHSDKYGAYESLANAKQFTWCPCWAHIRRKFFEAEGGDPHFRSWVLRKIRYLYMLERVAWQRTSEERLKIREEKEVPIIDELTQAIKAKLIDGKVLPKSKLREALGYYCGLIPHIKNYIKHPFSRLDNNVAERAVRPLAIGRKNWLFVGNEDGGEVSAVIYSLVQTCRALGVNPREYLEDVMRRLMSHPSSKLHELLPDKWASSQTSNKK